MDIFPIREDYKIEDPSECKDPGFVATVGEATFKDHAESDISECGSIQQSIFDRIPFPDHKSKSDFYNWLHTEYTEEQDQLRSEKKRKR